MSCIKSVLNSSCCLPLFFDRCRRRPKYSLKFQITGFTQNKRLKIFIICNNGNENTIHKTGVLNQGHKSKIFVFHYNNKYSTVKR